MDARFLSYFAMLRLLYTPSALCTGSIGNMVFLPVANKLDLLLWCNPPLLLVALGFAFAYMNGEIYHALGMQCLDLVDIGLMSPHIGDQTHCTHWEAMTLRRTFM